MPPRSGLTGYRSGRDGLPTAASAVTLRERTRARAVALGLDSEWAFEALGDNFTGVQTDAATGVAGDSGGWINVDAGAGAANATLTIYQGLAATRLAINISNISWIYTGRMKVVTAMAATTDIRVGIAALAGLAAPNGFQIGNSIMNMIALGGGTTAVPFVPVQNVAFNFRLEYVANANSFDLYINDVFQGRRALTNGANAVPVVAALKTASNDAVRVQQLYCWTKALP
jgi:hypothetical protein